MTRVLRPFIAILRKDATIEFRTREVLFTVGIFALLLVVVFAFAFQADPSSMAGYGPGVIWATILFFTTIGQSRLFDRERENDGLWALLLSPVDPAVVFLAKVTGSFVLAVLMELVSLPLVFVLFDLTVWSPLLLLGALLLGTLALTLVGTLFSAMLMRARMKEVLLPLVTYPLLMPVLMAGVRLTGAALGLGMPESDGFWLRFLTGFDLVVCGMSLALFGRMIRA